VIASNLGLAAAYAVVGRFAENYDAFPVAIASSIVAPVIFALLFQAWSQIQRRS
jgi:hypothetical protein